MHSVQVERNFTQFVVFAEDPILSALNKITANQSRLIFVVSEAGILQGVLSDGDFRRWIGCSDVIDLNRPVTAAMNPQCLSAPEASSATDLASLFSQKIQVIPCWITTAGWWRWPGAASASCCSVARPSVKGRRPL